MRERGPRRAVRVEVRRRGGPADRAARSDVLLAFHRLVAGQLGLAHLQPQRGRGLAPASAVGRVVPQPRHPRHLLVHGEEAQTRLHEARPGAVVLAPRDGLVPATELGERLRRKPQLAGAGVHVDRVRERERVVESRLHLQARLGADGTQRRLDGVARHDGRVRGRARDHERLQRGREPEAGRRHVDDRALATAEVVSHRDGAQRGGDRRAALAPALALALGLAQPRGERPGHRRLGHVATRGAATNGEHACPARGHVGEHRDGERAVDDGRGRQERDLARLRARQERVEGGAVPGRARPVPADAARVRRVVGALRDIVGLVDDDHAPVEGVGRPAGERVPEQLAGRALVARGPDAEDAAEHGGPAVVVGEGVVVVDAHYAVSEAQTAKALVADERAIGARLEHVGDERGLPELVVRGADDGVVVVVGRVLHGRNGLGEPVVPGQRRLGDDPRGRARRVVLGDAD